MKKLSTLIDYDLDINVNVKKDGLEDLADTMERIGDAMPNIVVRNNENVYLTINNWINDNKEEQEEEDD